MDLKQIEKLMAAMERMQIKRVVLKREDFEIEIEKECAEPLISSYMPPPIPTHAPAAPLKAAEPPQEETKESPSGVYVSSPMVGTI